MHRVKRQLLFVCPVESEHPPALFVCLLNWREYALLHSLLSSLDLCPSLHFLLLLACVKLDKLAPNTGYLQTIQTCLANIQSYLSLHPASPVVWSRQLHHFVAQEGLLLRHSNTQVLFQLMVIQLSQCNPRVAVQLSHHGLLLPIHDETLKTLLFSMVFKYEL